MTAPELHAVVDVLHGAEPVFEAANRIEQIRHQQAIDDEAAAIGRADRLLADRLHEAHQRSCVSWLVASARITSTSFINGTGLKKCRPATLSGRFVPAPSSVMQSDDVFDAMMQFGPTTASTCGVGLLLDLDVFDDRFDDEIAILQIGVLRRAGQVAEHGLLLFFGDLALFDAAGQELVDAAESLLQHVLIHFEDDGLEAGRRRHLRDARAHQPATQHTNRLDRHQ